MLDNNSDELRQRIVAWSTNYTEMDCNRVRDAKPLMDDLWRRIEKLEAFRAAVVGWREYDQPEWFCRRTAETIADLGREQEKQKQ